MLSINTNQDKIFIGIDVSKETLDISIQNQHKKIANTVKAIEEWIELTQGVKEATLAVIEATGGYERKVQTIFHSRKIPLHRAHPQRVYNFARVCNHFAKTDKLDATLLQKYAEFIEKEEKGDESLSPVQFLLKDLRATERTLEDSVQANKCRSHLLEKHAKKYVLKLIRFEEKLLQEVRKDIQKLIAEDADLCEKKAILKTMKGVGEKVSTVLITDVPELGMLNKKEIATLIGVAPKTSESGKKVYRAHIRGGRFYARKALYMSAIVAIRFNKPMKEFYEILSKAGKRPKVGITAVMRKILIQLNAMVRDRKPYTPVK